MTPTLTIRSVDGTAVAALRGEIDLQNSPEVRKELLASLADHRNIVVDLALVDYIDSSGIACLVEAYQIVHRGGGRFSLASVSAAALRVLKLARLDEVFVIHPHVEDALKEA